MRVKNSVPKLRRKRRLMRRVKGFRGVFGYMTGVIVHETGLVITRNSVTLEEAPQIKCHR